MESLDVGETTFSSRATCPQFTQNARKGENAPVQRYAITQFCGDDVLNIFIMAYRDEDRTLDQLYEKQLLTDFYYGDFNSL